ncbi:Antilisterial bacteriocin subtilosin biosynthesis protein AlbA [Pelotomaculum schinkii]|uniref:Antilisterial bacteriocin subtilosin biosynthesis protein AlbA n=1 Tax=Pelotomaculum schinkii TaxID=78350 RepID=A0A4Y7RA08_9FIRM|nr:MULTISPECIES: radical SAM protein [Pelotomaculum]TEB05784.1 Antilisterial bacteriocin subtilosin biosynthesis protein AlbA [Pelotomaculum schinkii]TEB17951.1 Antilisterial bacteriocin subtilosin biosynthesis protein AlbA [Pelotomaculum sp. FP]
MESSLLRLSDNFVVIEDSLGERGRLYHVPSLTQVNSVSPLMLKTIKLLMQGQRPKKVPVYAAQKCDIFLETEILDCISDMFRVGILVEGQPKEYCYGMRKSYTKPPLDMISLELTTRCNLKCIHCYVPPIAGAKSKELSNEEIKRLIDDAVELGVWRFSLTGGEIFLRDDILDILHYLRFKGMVIDIFTNATLIDDAMIGELAKLKLRQLATTITGLGPTHDRFQGTKGAYNKVCRTIAKLKEKGIALRINVILHKSNRNEFYELIQIIRRLGFSWRISNIMSLGRGKESNYLNLPEQQFADMLASAYEAKITSNIVIQGRHPVEQIDNDGPIAPSCGVGSFRMFISAVGETGLCEVLSHSTNPKFGSGNIRDRSIKEIWEYGEGFNRYRNFQCNRIDRCQHASLCRGGCRARAYIEGGSVEEPDKIACFVLPRIKHDSVPR